MRGTKIEFIKDCKDDDMVFAEKGETAIIQEVRKSGVILASSDIRWSPWWFEVNESEFKVSEDQS